MTIKRMLMLLLLTVSALMTLCCHHGKVEQGRVIAYDKTNGLVTIIRDSTPTAARPTYDALPPLTVKVPADPTEMGEQPEAGKRLVFDTQARKLVVYDGGSGALRTVIYAPVIELANVAGYDPRVKGVKFPIVDREKKTITLYSPHDKKLVTFTVADDHFVLPDDTWKAGDEIRYYYKEPGQALRMMNVTKTDIMKG